MASIFEIKPAANDQLQFFFYNSQREALMMSGTYESREQVEAAIQDVRVGSLISQQIAKGKVASGETFFVIKDSSGQIIAKSILFDTEMRFDNALHTVKDNACIAQITYSK